MKTKRIKRPTVTTVLSNAILRKYRTFSFDCFAIKDSPSKAVTQIGNPKNKYDKHCPSLLYLGQLIWLSLVRIGSFVMARKRNSNGEIIKLLHEIEIHLSSSSDICSACRSVGISDANLLQSAQTLWWHGRISVS